MLGKSLSGFFRLTNTGGGSTWPGHIALKVNKNFTRQVLEQAGTKTIIVAGTNGKTTTASLIKKALKKNGKKVFQNKAGANLLNGIASSIIIKSDISGKLNYDYAVLEIDENTLPQVLNQIAPDYLVLLNLFRDQLDRYGEVHTIASGWTKAIMKLTDKTTLILNADDPQVAYLGEDTKAAKLFFGLADLGPDNKLPQHSADSIYCPKCGNKLTYKKTIFSHLGDWLCNKCGLKKPKANLSNFDYFPLPGEYNKYDTLAAVLTLKNIGLSSTQIINSFKLFRPSFGRQEIIGYKDKKIQLFLSKNPTSFNESYKTICDLGADNLLIVLNDRIPDGRDISWIWDIDLPGIDKFKNISVSGDRVYDMALRLKYELGINNHKLRVKTYEDLKQAIEKDIELIDEKETLFILPTYSAMLETRKILTGKKIL